MRQNGGARRREEGGRRGAPVVFGLIRNLLLLVGPSLAVTLLLLEIFFRWVIPAAEIPHRTFDRVERMIHFDVDGPREGLFTRGRFAQLRARWRINNYGWNSDVDYVSASERPRDIPLVAIVGDSFVNSFQVDPDKNLAAVLREILGGRFEVYRFGVPGAPLSHYLHLARYAERHFAPDVLVVNVVHNDFHASLWDLEPKPFYLQLALDGGELVETSPSPPTTSGAPWWLHSATLRYLRITLQSYLLAGTPRGEGTSAVIANVPVDDVDTHAELIRRAVHLLVRRIAEESGARTVIFVMDAPRLDLYAGSLETSRVSWLNELLREACREAGVAFVDLTETFASAYAATGERFESRFDSHWNESGHRHAAAAIRDELERLGELRAPVAASKARP